jgi:hypothetical protein
MLLPQLKEMTMTAASRKGTSTKEGKTIAWFEREIQAHTPTTSLLDATSLGIWSIAEESGVLAGVWKKHRILQQDLDLAVLSAALGELLAAVVCTASAVDLSLEALMEQQAARVQLQPVKGKAIRAPNTAKISRLPKGHRMEETPTKATLSAEKRPRKIAGEQLAPTSAGASHAQEPVVPTAASRGKGKHSTIPATVELPPSLPAKAKRQRGALSRLDPIQPPLLTEPPMQLTRQHPKRAKVAKHEN